MNPLYNENSRFHWISSLVIYPIIALFIILGTLAVIDALHYNQVDYETALRHCTSQLFFTHNRAFCMNEGVIP